MSKSVVFAPSPEGTLAQAAHWPQRGLRLSRRDVALKTGLTR